MCSCYAMCSWLNDWRYMSLMSIYDTWIERWLYWMIEIHVDDENIWCLDGEMGDGFVMLDLLMCIKVIRVHMNVRLELMDLNWCDDCLISLCIVEWVCLTNDVSLLCNIYVLFDWMLEVYVVDENILQCICAFDWLLEVCVVDESMWCLNWGMGLWCLNCPYAWMRLV